VTTALPIRVGIVGCGRISDLHALGYRDREDAGVVAVCDSVKRRARKKAGAWGVERVYRDYRKFLSDPEIDLVELLVPHHLHAEMTIAACQAGKHVSVQKPMALTVREADEMIEAAQQAGVILRVFENFCFYPPHVRAKEMIEAGEIGEPHMIRIHLNTGTRDTAWKVPLSSQLWRMDERKNGGGFLVFDHGYHLFSLARYLMGEVERVYGWIDCTPDLPGVSVDAPATIMFQFKSPRRYGVMDVAHTPRMRIDSQYYADDDRLEVIGEKGILFVNRCTARTVDLPALMMFRDGKTTGIPLERVEWHHGFVDCTHHLLDVLRKGGQPVLDGRTGRAVLQFTLAAHISAREGREVRPDEVG
jgi:predicted dehydrogenase